MMSHMLDANGMGSDEFASLVFAAIERGEYWIVPQPEMLYPLLEARNKIIAERTVPVFAWTPETVE